MMQRIDPPRPRVTLQHLVALRDKVRDGLWDADADEINSSLFSMRSIYPISSVPIEFVDRNYSDQLPSYHVTAYKYEFQYTHIDEDLDYWIEPGYEVKTGHFYNEDGTIQYGLCPRYINEFEAAEQFRSRFLTSTILNLRQVNRRIENDFEVIGWQACLYRADEILLSSSETDIAPRSIIASVLSTMIDYPEETFEIDIIRGI